MIVWPQRNRALFDRAGRARRAFDLMSRARRRQTTLPREDVAALRPTLRIGVVEGDIQTSLDANVLSGQGRSGADPIRTVLAIFDREHGGRCRGAARSPNALRLLNSIRKTWGTLGSAPAEFSNVGGGEHAKAMILSLARGRRQPLKYL